MHKLLHLQHHSHTAKHLPHHHTSYRALLLVVVLLGSLLIWLNRVSALDYNVTAAVMAPLPSGTPVIETPDPETVFTASDQVEIVGSCTVVIPALVVILLRDGEPIGSGVCQADGTFRIPITMVLGENIISVKYKTITGEDGPPGQTMVLYYSPKSLPGNPTIPGGQSSETPAVSDPLVIKTVDFVPYAIGEKLLLSAQITGGTAPYVLKIDWGDGTFETFTVTGQTAQELSHVYTVAKATMTVIMEATDANGQKTMVHLAAVYKAGRQLIGPPATATGRPSVIDRWMSMGLWLGYAITITSLGAFWVHAKNFTASKALYVPAGKRRARSRGSRT